MIWSLVKGLEIATEDRKPFCCFLPFFLLFFFMTLVETYVNVSKLLLARDAKQTSMV